MFDQVAANKRRSRLLIAGFVVLIVAVGGAIDVLLGYGGVWTVVAFLIAVGGVATSWWKSDAIALRVSRAVPADAEQYARYHNVVEGLCIAAGLPKPRLYVVDDPAPNAFATGRDPKHAAVAVTTGLLEKMDRVELEAVLAHELGHIKNYDILVSTLAVTLVGVVMLLSDIALRSLWWGGGRGRRRGNGGGGSGFALLGLFALVLLVLSPFVARLMQFAISRRRELLADVTGVTLTRYPPALISALEKLKADTTVVESASRATAHLWIEGPVPREKSEGRMAWLGRLFDTHPPLDERIEFLRQL